jgi:hypothetical protein
MTFEPDNKNRRKSTVGKTRKPKDYDRRLKREEMRQSGTVQKTGREDYKVLRELDNGRGRGGLGVGHGGGGGRGGAGDYR